MNAWLPYVYQYGISTLLVAGVVVAALRTGALNPARSEDRRTLLMVTGGLVFYALLHGVWLFAAWSFS